MDGGRCVAFERDLDENQRLIDQGGVEKRKTAAVVRIEPASEIVPAFDLMHGFIRDDLFQDGGGARPGHSPKHKEAAVEPGAEKVNEIPFDAREARVHTCQKVASHANQSRRAAWRQIEPAQKFLARRLHAHREPLKRFGTRIVQIGFCRALDAGCARNEAACQEGEDCILVRRVCLFVAIQDALRQRHARGLAPARYQRLAEAFEAVLPARADERGKIEDLPAPLRDLVEDFLEERNIHCQFPALSLCCHICSHNNNITRCADRCFAIKPSGALTSVNDTFEPIT